VAEEARTYGRGHLVGVAVAALAAGFYLGTVFMELRGPQPASVQAATAQAQVGQAAQEAAAAIPAKLAEQIRGLEQATLAKPGDQELWVELGNAYFDAHQAGRAVAAYEKAVALGPVGPDVWTDLGIMHREAGQARKAVECFDAAMKLDPRHENALYNKGVVLLHDSGDRAGAIAAWGRLLEVNPAARTPDGRSLAGIVAELKRG
jgi:cytochrome c-type biogenesis protein CcmH/NrfG